MGRTIITNKFKGRFRGVFPLNEAKDDMPYRKKKQIALEHVDEVEITKKEEKQMKQRDLVIHHMNKKLEISMSKIADIFTENGFKTTRQFINECVQRHRKVLETRQSVMVQRDSI